MSPGLLHRWADGDDGAFEALYRRWHPRLVRFASALLGSTAEGEDVAQETFLRLARSRAQLRRAGIDNGRALLYAIARRLAYTRSAYQHRWRSVGAQAEEVKSVLLSTAGTTPEELLAAAELGVRIQSAVDELPGPQRELILLRHREHLSYEEMAQVLRCSAPQVKARLHYARKVLRARLADLGITPESLA
ncbi:MAG: RNA polymerase sigma factor [Candidatus Latescibacterota bacterium]